MFTVNDVAMATVDLHKFPIFVLVIFLKFSLVTLQYLFILALHYCFGIMLYRFMVFSSVIVKSKMADLMTS